MLDLLFALAAIPFVYYLIAIYSTLRFARQGSAARTDDAQFTPPVSILKPVKGSDLHAYENFASFCRQDYPSYELLFCVDEHDHAVVALIDRLKREFPEKPIRVLLGSGRDASNDKAAKLARLVNEAEHEVLVISDSDVRARTDYLKTVVRPLMDPEVGAVTLPYVAVEERTFAEALHSVGMWSDFYAGLFVARQLDGVKFALGPTIATTRSQLARFGGYEAIENRPGDDLLVGRLIAEQGYKVELLSYTIETVSDFGSLRELFQKRLRWIVVMRHIRPWGHFGLLWTQGLPWAVAAALVSLSWPITAAYLGFYLLLRTLLMGSVARMVLRQKPHPVKFALIPVWDALAFVIWLVSFGRRRVHWRGSEYYIRNGQLVPRAETAQR